jgi:hypothetical protein
MSPCGYQSLARNIAIASLEQRSDLRSLRKIDRDNAKSIKNVAGALSEIAATGCPMDIDASPSGNYAAVVEQALPLSASHSVCILA